MLAAAAAFSASVAVVESAAVVASGDLVSLSMHATVVLTRRTLTYRTGLFLNSGKEAADEAADIMRISARRAG